MKGSLEGEIQKKKKAEANQEGSVTHVDPLAIAHAIRVITALALLETAEGLQENQSNLSGIQDQEVESAEELQWMVYLYTILVVLMTICTRSLVEAFYPWISRRGGEVIDWGKGKWQTWSQRVSTSSPVSISSTTSDLSESLSHAQGQGSRGDLQHQLSHAQGHSSSKDLSQDHVQEGCEDLQDPPSASSNPPQASLNPQVESSSPATLTIGGISVEFGEPISFRPRVTRWGKVYHTSLDCKYLNARPTGRSLEGKFCSQCAAVTQQRPREGDILNFEFVNFTGGTVRYHVNNGCNYHGPFQEMTCCTICSKRH